MKNTWIALLGLVLTSPSWAQDAPPADQPPAEAAPADQPPADASTPPADSGAAPAETPPADQPPADASAAPAETPPAETPPEQTADNGEPWGLYLGADYNKTKVSTSNAGSLGTNDYNGKFLNVRIGKRLFEAVGMELNYGVDASDFNKGEIETTRYYGLFVVPTATLFETFELAFPVGYGRGQYTVGNTDATSSSVAYGFRAEFPLKKFSDSMPDLRLTAGWMIWNQTTAARVYGPSFGLRYDFQVPNPGLGKMFGHLWPFGGSDDKPADAPAS